MRRPSRHRYCINGTQQSPLPARESWRVNARLHYRLRYLPQLRKQLPARATCRRIIYFQIYCTRSAQISLSLSSSLSPSFFLSGSASSRWSYYARTVEAARTGYGRCISSFHGSCLFRMRARLSLFFCSLPFLCFGRGSSLAAVE